MSLSKKKRSVEFKKYGEQNPNQSKQWTLTVCLKQRGCRSGQFYWAARIVTNKFI